MADIYCPRCGEPWDLDTLHEEVAARKEEGNVEVTFETVVADFRDRGCGLALTAFSLGRACDHVSSSVTAASRALFELLGDDIDGVANEMEDFLQMGGAL